jgi:hypothetical protein
MIMPNMKETDSSGVCFVGQRRLGMGRQVVRDEAFQTILPVKRETWPPSAPLPTNISSRPHS